MHTRWVNFIKTGNPDTGSGETASPVWPAYNADTSQIMVFDDTLSVKETRGKSDMLFMQDIMFGAGSTCF